MTTILNMLWFIFGGWISGLLWILAGCILAVTIIGLPWAPSAFRIVSFSFWPFGRYVAPKNDDVEVDFILNILWVIFAGWWLALHHLILAVVLGVTLIGIPFAIQHVKLALISFTPVGKTVVSI